MTESAQICSVDEVPAEGVRVVTLNGRNLAVINHGGKYYAVENRCPHMGGPLGLGQVKNGIITCPWHRFRFELESGRSVTNPAMQATVLRLTVDKGYLVLEFQAGKAS